jgi:flavin-dependent dehydrogenase
VIAPTISMDDAARREWDIIVVGAGPAGALAARESARWGAAVLLVDRAQFPRPKVCGCCLNGRALGVLKSVGLSSILADLGAVPLQRACISNPIREARVQIPVGMSVSREALDAALLQSAIGAGASFLPRTRAALDRKSCDHRRVSLHGIEHTAIARARVVIAANGLASELLERETGAACVWPNARLGLSALCARVPSFYRRGTIYLACGPGGYVGLVRLEDERLEVAAALDPVAMRRAGGPTKLASSLIDSARWPPVPSLSDGRWHGTPLLTRIPTARAAERLFAVGDAAGYIEPFTGEGIGWALAGGRALAPLAVRAGKRWQPSFVHEWEAVYRKTVRDKQQACWSVTRLLRSAVLTTAMLGVMSVMPASARLLLERMNRPEWSPGGRGEWRS